MKHVPVIVVLIWIAAAAIVSSKDSSAPSSRDTKAPTAAGMQEHGTPSFQYGGGDLDPSELVGAEIWFKATAGNERFFTYAYPQRLGVAIDWYRVLNTASRPHRFNQWGLINDPDCCTPGDPNCPAKSDEETYGFDYCPGDDVLLASVGKSDYRDPACDLKDAPVEADPHGPADQRQSACDLRFGTSTGAMGLRKFPNPKFSKDQWLKMNKGRLGTWTGYNERMQPATPALPSIPRLVDGSIEPPFLVGMSCGSCHIAFNPLHPPKDPAKPARENISGTVGNQYSRFSQILGSGVSPQSIEYQVFAHARPGIVDTSAIPNDQINNPGTINAIVNFSQRPTFPEDVTKWRKTAQCPANADQRSCWCEPGRDHKCWERSRKTEPVHHILKGGEDSIGIREAVQRVYINIGSCSEESWVNHLTDMRQLDPSQRGFGQTPFQIGQARRDCPSFRAIEDRLGEVVKFLLSARPADLYQARGLKESRDQVEQLDKEYGPGSVDRGKMVFAKTCARCHSTQQEPFGGRDFTQVAKDPKGNSTRTDWLGNDQLIPVTEIGTQQARSLHSNHMAGHVWEEYGSETLRAKPPDPNIKEPSEGGRGYYRNISLINVWAYAPFMHNNAIGPELCGGPQDEHYISPYVDQQNKRLMNPPACWRFDPSVEGRYKLYKASMQELLNPDKRLPKVTLFNQNVVIKVFPKVPAGDLERYVATAIVFPEGTPSSRIGNFRHKEFANDLILSRTDFGKLKAKYVARYGAEQGDKIAVTIRDKAGEILVDPTRLLEVGGELREVYSNSLMLRENEGHQFGEDLSDQEKNALIAFLATL